MPSEQTRIAGMTNYNESTEAQNQGSIKNSYCSSELETRNLKNREKHSNFLINESFIEI